MNNNIYGIDLGTCNFKIFCKSTGEVLKEKNTIAVKDKNTLYAYGDSAYEMYEKAPEDIRVIFPVVSGVIAEFDYLLKIIKFCNYTSCIWCNCRIWLSSEDDFWLSWRKNENET